MFREAASYDRHTDQDVQKHMPGERGGRGRGRGQGADPLVITIIAGLMAHFSLT